MLQFDELRPVGSTLLNRTVPTVACRDMVSLTQYLSSSKAISPWDTNFVGNPINYTRFQKSFRRLYADQARLNAHLNKPLVYYFPTVTSTPNESDEPVMELFLSSIGANVCWGVCRDEK